MMVYLTEKYAIIAVPSSQLCNTMILPKEYLTENGLLASDSRDDFRRGALHCFCPGADTLVTPRLFCADTRHYDVYITCTSLKSIHGCGMGAINIDSISHAFQWITLKNYPFPLRDLHLHLIHVSMNPPDPAPKRHLDHFSRFRIVHERDQQTHTHTDRQTDHSTRV